MKQQTAFPAHESIRVVPIHQPKVAVGIGRARSLKNAPAPAPTKLTYRGGPLLANVEVFTVFWGANWKSLPLSGIATSINKFFTTILSSSLMTQMGEYSVPSYKIGNGKLTGTYTTSVGAPKNSITDTQLQAQLTKWIQTDKNFPKVGPNTLYFIYLANGVTVSMGGSKSCASFCGYHNVTGQKTYYAIMPYPGCNGCLGGLSVTDALTGTSSHELCEAITDPVPGSGWYDDVHGEIGDICAWKFKTLNGFNVQLEWSNSQNKCI